MSPFSAIIPNFQTTWDSTSVGWFKECPTLYRYQMIEGWTTRSKGIHLYFGSLYAASLERYAHSRAVGDDHDTATLKMVRWAMENSGERSVDGVWTPWDSGDSIKNRVTLVRSLIWNVEDRLNSAFSTLILSNGKPAVELSFNFAAYEIGGETIHLAGHLDEVVTTADGGVYIRDDKTTKSYLSAQYFKQYTPNNQMSLYSIAGRIVFDLPVRGVLVRAAQIGVNFTRFATAQAPRPKAVLDEWFSDTERWIKLAKSYAEEGHWPKNDKSCNSYGGCPFRAVCAVSPNHRQSWLEQDFVRREWNPLIQRGDI